MHYPSFGEYSDALRLNLEVVLSDPVLGRGTLCTRGPGLPAVHGGTYALTFAVVTSSGKFAVRCFHKELDSLPVRYGAIERHLGRINSPYFVDCQFQPNGITTESGTYPIVRMEWVEGPNLAAYVADHRHDAGALLELRFALRRLAMHLRAKGVAHGDIQPSNVIVQGDGNLRLIDYDGLFVPELATIGSAELGQRNFQHPGRQARHFDASLDVFSFAVIDFALRALSVRPDLWDLTSSGEDAFLLRATDFTEPAHSAILALLGREPGFEQRTRDLASVCVAPFESIPPLEDFVAGRGIPAATVELFGDPAAHEPPPYVPANCVVDAADFAQCCRHVGERVELVGRVVSVARGPAPTEGAACVRVEFSDPACDMTCLTLWPDSLSRLETVPDESWVGQWVSAVGLVEPVASDRGGVPYQKDVSITIEGQGQLQRLTEAEASHRLRSQGVPAGRSLDPAGRVRTEPVAAVARAQDAVRAPTDVVPARRPRPSRGYWWVGAAVLVLSAGYLLLSVEPAREPKTPSVAAVDAPSPAAIDAVQPAPVAPTTPRASIETAVAELISKQDLKATDTTIETVVGALSILPAEDGQCQRIGLPDGNTVPDLCEDRIAFAHRAVFADREVIVGFTRCDDAEAPCGLRRPFWLELRTGSPPTLRHMPTLWVGSSQPVVSASSAGVEVDLGTWNGERRLATLSAAGNLVVERSRAPIRALSRSDCAIVARSLEDCAVNRDCGSFALSAQRIPASRWAGLKRAYHETTGLDVAVFRNLCVRSCELGFTPSYELIRRNACDGAKPDQWPLDDPAGGLQR
jgi:serine/threonine protein kinase